MEGMDASSLVRRAADNDPEALQELWRRHRRWVAATLLAHMPRDAELDDLLQEVALSMIRKLSELRDPDLFRPWLRTIAVNAAITAGRRRRTRLRLVRPAPDTIPVERSAAAAEAPSVAFHAPPPSAAEQRDEARRALELARELHPDYSEPLLMRCVHNMTYTQIADALDVPVTTVETRLARARRMLRELIERESAGHVARA